MTRLAALPALTFLLLGLAPREAQAGGVIAGVSLNGAETPGVYEFDIEGERIGARPDVLLALGFSPARVGRLAPGAVAHLDELGGVSGRYVGPEQRIDLTVDPDWLTPSTLPRTERAYAPPVTADPGALLNYGISVNEFGGRHDAAALADLRLFGPRGQFLTGFLLRESSEGTEDGLRRLDTAFVRDDYATGRHWVLGDFISAGLAWSPSLRAAGISFSTDRTLRPDLFSQPQVHLSGAAAAPSTVDIFVDGVRTYSGQTRPGPFTAEIAPTFDGRGEVTSVVTDALGRQTVQTFSFYAADGLLRAGTSELSGEVGLLRENYARPGDRYRGVLAAMTARIGLSDAATLELQGASADGVQNLGVGIKATLAGEALAHVAVRGSHAGSGDGAQLFVSLRRETRRFAAFASGRFTSAGFIDGGLEDSFRPRSEVFAGASARDPRWGSLSFSVSDVRFEDDRLATAGLSWSRPFGPVDVFASATRLVAGGSDTALRIGLTAPLGRPGLSAGVRTETSDAGTRLSARLTQTPVEPDGWGWRLAADTSTRSSDNARLEAEARKLSPVGDFDIGVARYGETGAFRASMQGGLVWFGGGLRATARVGSAFALIETGAPDIAVTVNNRYIGRTGADGRLLATRLNAFSATRIGLRPEDIPLDREIDTDFVSIVPPRAGGVRVALPVRRAAGVTLYVILTNGRPAPAGLSVRRNGREIGVTGFGGMAFVDGHTPDDVIEIASRDGVCRLEVPDDATALGQAGPLLCDLRPLGRLRHADRGGPERRLDGVVYGADGGG